MHECETFCAFRSFYFKVKEQVQMGHALQTHFEECFNTLILDNYHLAAYIVGFQ